MARIAVRYGAAAPGSWGLLSDGTAIKRFRRIALRCEKTIASFRGFVSLSCASVRRPPHHWFFESLGCSCSQLQLWG